MKCLLAAFAWALMLAMPAVRAAPAPSAKPVMDDYYVAVDVDVRGHVTDAQAESDTPPDLTQVLQRAARQHVFEPAMRAAHAVKQHLYTHWETTARPRAGGRYAVSVKYLGHGPRLRPGAAPRYPPSMVRARREAELLFRATVTADGGLSNVQPVRVRTSGGHRADEFLVATRASIKQWHAKPERIDGKPVRVEVLIPVRYWLPGSPTLVKGYRPRDLKPVAGMPAEKPVDDSLMKLPVITVVGFRIR